MTAGPNLKSPVRTVFRKLHRKRRIGASKKPSFQEKETAPPLEQGGVGKPTYGRFRNFSQGSGTNPFPTVVRSISKTGSPPGNSLAFLVKFLIVGYKRKGILNHWKFENR
jgi:hypothetical protein